MATFSPEVEAWLAGLGPDPFTPVSYDYWQPVAPPSDLGDLGTLDYQNAALTMLGKANKQYSDMAQIAQLGATTGGPSPDQFDPIATYTPVQAPGYMAMNYYMNSNDPIMSYAAKRLSEGATALQVETELRKLVANDPQTAAAMPIYEDDMGGGPKPDWKRLGQAISKLEMDVLNDPQFNGFDPNTGLPAQISYEDTEIAKYFKERNLPNPYETYSPDLLAGRDQLSREGYNADKQKESDSAFEAAKRFLASARARADSGNNAKPFGMMLDPEDAPAAQARQQRMDAIARTQQQAGEYFPGQDFAVSSQDWNLPIPGRLDQTSAVASRGGLPNGSPAQQPKSVFRDHLAGASRNAANVAAQKAYVNAILARKDNEKRRTASAKDKIAQIDRQRMIDMLTRRGVTPFNDVNRARQSSVFGM